MRWLGILSHVDRQWEATVRGQFHSVDLAVVSSPHGKVMQGMGELNLAQAVFRNGTLREVRGVFTSESCIADTDWLDRMFASKWLLSDVSKSWKEMGLKVPVTGLGIRFATDQNSVFFSGTTPPPTDRKKIWPHLAAFVENRPIAFSNVPISLEAVTTAISEYPTPEPMSRRIASGRR